MKFITIFILLVSLRIEANECSSDTKKFCASIEPGKGQIAKCLSDYEAQLSPNCAKELKTFKAQTGAKNPCFEELAEYCVDIPSDPRKLEYCLLKNENRLGSKCLSDFKKKKGNLIVKDVCAQDVVNTCYASVTGPEGSINKCLIKNKSKLSKFCQNMTDKKIAELKKKNPCFDDTEKNCPTQVTIVEIQECLEKKITTLGAKCKQIVEGEKKKADENPCYKDLKKHCKPGLPPADQHRCLTINEKDLSNSCRQFRTREDAKVKLMVEKCEADRLKICPKAPFKDGMILKCLQENKAKVSKGCAELL